MLDQPRELVTPHVFAQRHLDGFQIRTSNLDLDGLVEEIRVQFDGQTHLAIPISTTHRPRSPDLQQAKHQKHRQRDHKREHGQKEEHDPRGSHERFFGLVGRRSLTHGFLT
jgi:hypothetical protein